MEFEKKVPHPNIFIDLRERDLAKFVCFISEVKNLK